MNNFFPLKVVELKKMTSDSVSIKFDVPEDLAATFSFKEGQYITLRKEIKGESVQRAYSIWKAPHENELTVLVKKVENGIFSSYANEVLAVGEELEVMAPQGHFVPELNPTNSNHYTLFAAGSGITPVFSILKAILKTEANSTIDLFYVNKTKESTIFKEEIEGLSTNKLKVHNIYTRDNSENSVVNGRINKESLELLSQKGLLNTNSFQFFSCGPESMILDIKEFLISKGTAESKIKFELFTTSGSDNVKEIETDITESKITITIDDDDFEYLYKIEGSDSILDEGIEQGLDLPYSCKGGVCCTCRAKVIEGTAKMKINYALTEQEVEDGYVLTCQTIPTSSVLKVSFDD
jgi:ring-1,2-phenylacetyl-CoA epoxidase subunit PaaE